VRDNPKVDGSEPWYASRSYGTDAVRKYGPLVDQAAKSAGLDADLVRAIMHVEHANGGFYGYAAQHAGIAKSLYPMNIRPDLWQTLAGPNADFDDPQTNIDAGVRLIKRIRDRLVNPSAARIATLYNNMAADFTSDYGAQVENAYSAKPWLLPPWIGRGPVPPSGYR
jgi:soluble lytic murein transglycosylase-like protein